MDLFAAYIPMDRRQALANGIDLPLTTSGAALFADISGFTPLTEALAMEMGPQRGAEELTHHLNHVYDTLIGVLHRYGGSVIGFSGDAITCWFDGDDGSLAIACALKMQTAMGDFSTVTTASGKSITLTIKIAISTGVAKRFVVGDPDILIIDVLTGAVLDKLAEAEHIAEKGEVILDPATTNRLQDKLNFHSLRIDQDSGDRYGVVDRLKIDVLEKPWAKIHDKALNNEKLRPWILTAVFNRLEAGQGDYLAELRPAAALFLRFRGIDFDTDPQAELKLDDLVRRIERILEHYEGTLIQLTIGDKGSYLYAAFGAPFAHEDDPIRAVSAALDLQTLCSDLEYIKSIQIGITRGRMRTGAYGSLTRRTYGVLGDAVNLAARLMQAASAGEILISEKIYHSISDQFSASSLPDLRVKGKTEPIRVYRLNAHKIKSSIRLHDQKFTGPLVGRESEISAIEARLESAKAGAGQILGIVAEAGMGKSRLVAEVLGHINEDQYRIHTGECLSYGTKSSYLVWQDIWRGLFGIDPNEPSNSQAAVLEAELQRLNPNLAPRLPLLNILLNLNIPENDLTRSMDSKLRKSSLESLLVECLRVMAKASPILIVLEDLHWIDPLSLDLLEAIGRAIRNLPIVILGIYRPLDNKRQEDLRVFNLPYYHQINLNEFTPQQAERLIQIRFGEQFGKETRVPKTLVERITTRAQGNPFYIEELIIYIRNQQIDLSDTNSIDEMDLPVSVHSLILSRMDQLLENDKTMLKVASVIGRTFDKQTLQVILPGPEKNGKVEIGLITLCKQEFISPEVDQVDLYIFRHIVTQEVTYGSLPYEQRAHIHDRVGGYLEAKYSAQIDQFVGLLAHHYGRSKNDKKKREYLLKAGIAAQNNYANDAAIVYFQRLIPLLKKSKQADIIMKLGKLFERVGNWQQAKLEYENALDIATDQNDKYALAWCQTSISELLRKQGQYDEASVWLMMARSTFEQLGDKAGVGQTLHNGGTLAAQQGNFDQAVDLYSSSLEIRRELKDNANIGSLLSNLGIISGYRGDFQGSYQLYRESLDIRREVGDKAAIAISLTNLGNAALALGKYDEARRRLEEALALQREVGDQWGIGNALNNLANVARSSGNYQEASNLYKESLVINRDLGDMWALAFLLEDIAGLKSMLKEPKLALQLVGTAAALREEIGSPLPPSARERLEETLEFARNTLSESEQKAAWDAGKQMPLDKTIDIALCDEYA